jgi:chondroitin AC lyase
VAFYKNGEVEIAKGAKLRMDSQGMAMLKMNNNRLTELILADPSRKLSRISVTVPGIYAAKGEGYFSVPDSKQNTTLLVVDLPQGVYAGKSVSVKL